MYFYYEVYVSSVKQRKIGKIRFNLLHPDLGSTSEWLVNKGNLLQSIRSTTPIWVVTCHQYGISWLVLRRSFCGESNGCDAKCQLFSQTSFFENYRNVNDTWKLLPVEAWQKLHKELAYLSCYVGDQVEVDCLMKVFFIEVWHYLAIIYFSGYGLGRQFTHHHEVTAANSTTKTQDSEREPTEGTRHLVSITLDQDVLGQ